MSTPSITLRLDFGDGQSGDGAARLNLQQTAPTPMDGLQFGVADAAAVPTPMMGVGALSVQQGASGADGAPMPSDQIGALAAGAGGDGVPRPEGIPAQAT